MIQKILILSLLSLLITACVSAEEMNAIRRMSDSRLCNAYMDVPSVNIYSNAYLTVINERGINCYQFGNVAQRKRAADNEFSTALEKYAETTRASSAVSQPKPAAAQLVLSQTQTVYDRNGRRIEQVRCQYSDGTLLFVASGYRCPQTK